MLFGGKSGGGWRCRRDCTMLLAVPVWGQGEARGPAAPGAAPANLIPAKAVEAPGPVAAAPAPAAAPDTLSPSQLMNGPSLRETGRIAVAPAPAPSRIETDSTPVSPKEKSIAPAASSIDVAPAAAPSRLHQSARAGQGDHRTVRPDRELPRRGRARQAGDADAGRRGQAAPALDHRARRNDRLDRRRGDAPVDLGIMDCAKRVMSQWKFTPPRGGPQAGRTAVLVLAQHLVAAPPSPPARERLGRPTSTSTRLLRFESERPGPPPRLESRHVRVAEHPDQRLVAGGVGGGARRELVVVAVQQALLLQVERR